MVLIRGLFEGMSVDIKIKEKKGICRYLLGMRAVHSLVRGRGFDILCLSLADQSIADNESPAGSQHQ